MIEKQKLTPMQDLILHVMYEHQVLAGKNEISKAEIEMHIADALFEFDTPALAVNGIRSRLGLDAR